MLKFQRRLVDVRGLTPSRSSLMQTPDLSSDLGKVRRRNLVTDFAQEDGEDVLMLGESFIYPPGTPSPSTVHMPGVNQTITSDSDRFSMLCSSQHPFVGNIGGPMSVGWSEARLVYGYGWNQPSGWDGTMLQPSFGLSGRSTSRFLNLPS